MAEEIRGTRDDAGVAGAHSHPSEVREHADVEATVPPEIRPVQTDDPDVARAEIEMTRSRMSETIDEIEDKLIAKRDQLQSRLDFLTPIRQNPLPSVGIALGAGVLVGLLTGGDDEPDHYEHDEDHWEDRARTWEIRARRLLEIAQEQEDELEALSEGRAVPRRPAWDDEDEEYRHDEEEVDEDSPFRGLRDALEERITAFVGDAVHQFVGRVTPV